MVKFYVLLRTSSSKTQMFLLKKPDIFQEYRIFCSRFIAFAFALSLRFFVLIRIEQLSKDNVTTFRRPLRAPDQIPPDRFNVINMEFLSLMRKRLSCEKSRAIRSKEKRLYSHARSAQPDCSFLSSVHSISGFLVKLSKNAQNLSGGPVLTVLEMTDNLLLNCNQKNPILKLIQTEFCFGPFFTRTF